MKPVIVRPANELDHPSVSTLLREAELPPIAVEGLENGIVADHDGEVSGFVALERHGDNALLRSAVVSERYRGQGIGKKLTARLLEEARALGVHDVYLLTLTADQFFEKFGFSRVPRTEAPSAVSASSEFADLCPDDARVYRLSFDDSRTTDAMLKSVVRKAYSRVATNVDQSCGCDCGCKDSFAEDYMDVHGYVPDADLGLGCGIPTEVAGLKPGEVVLDLGSGAGIDAFVAARAVGDSGHVIGLDFTPEMIARARDNARSLGLANVEFVQGDIETMPLPDSSVDVIVSNCVLNLVPDKRAAFREMLRVLRPGGRFAVSDIVRLDDLPVGMANDPVAYAACIAGASHRDEYLEGLGEAGFIDVAVHSERQVHSDLHSDGGPDVTLLSLTVSGKRPLTQGNLPDQNREVSVVTR